MKYCLSLCSIYQLVELSGENAVLAGKAGAIDAVVAAMRAHVGNAGVSERACGAIGNICIHGPPICVFCNNIASF